jgi:hypothetical protein
MIRTHKIFYICLIALFIGLLFFTSGLVWADEVSDSVEEAMEYYKEGDFVEAANSLDYASQLIRQKRSSNLEVFLPDPLSDWTAEDIKSQAGGTGILGGMISVKRTYRKDQGSITVEIIVDSPGIQSIIMVLSNPAYASADGGKLTKIKKQNAIIKYRPSGKNGEINIVVAKKYLVNIEGRNVSENDLVDYASAIDYHKLKKF